MNKKLGIAVDVGTTTIAMHTIDLGTGERLDSYGALNPQGIHGADVSSRISYCAQNGHEPLSELIRKSIDEYAAHFENIEHVVIAGNTIMQHLVAGFSPVSMGASPFTPLSLFGETLPAWESLLELQDTDVYYTPAISAYVGGDITAGLLAADFERIYGTALLLDIGTNGEIVLKHEGVYYCCAAAAGPAFEGAEITKGMSAQKGAIDHVWQETSGIEYSVIDNAIPQGLCGSGLLDLLAVLIEKGEVDETGRLVGKDRFYLPNNSVNEKISVASASSDMGESEVYITATDVRKLQLAKAAIAGGIQVLLHYAGIKESDIELLALSGGFGSYLNPESAARIGLFPKVLLPVAKAYGNTAGDGAAKVLYSPEARVELETIRKKSEYIELSSNALFNDKFMEEMVF